MGPLAWKFILSGLEDASLGQPLFPLARRLRGLPGGTGECNSGIVTIWPRASGSEAVPTEQIMQL
jgi:hypothetical protein